MRKNGYDVVNDMKIGTPIFFNYVGYHRGKDLTMKEKDYFRSFQWKNALPSGAKVYWNNITCLCKQFIVVSITNRLLSVLWCLLLWRCYSPLCMILPNTFPFKPFVKMFMCIFFCLCILSWIAQLQFSFMHTFNLNAIMKES